MPVELGVPEHQPHARMVLGNSIASLSGGDKDRAALSHAYLFEGPPGVGKRDAARSFAAEILAAGQNDSDGIKRRAFNGNHPDLTWIVPRGAHGILVADVREQVVAAVWRRPFEAARSVYVIEQADLMNQEAANALLKTLEEPPPYAHLILTSDMPERLSETIRSRCQFVHFAPLSAELISQELAGDGVLPDRARACARISAGNAKLARSLAGEGGEVIRDLVKQLVVWVDGDDQSQRPWLNMLKLAEEAGSKAEESAKDEIDEVLEFYPKGRDRQRVKREFEQAAKRRYRRELTATLDLQLKLAQYMFRDLVALDKGASEQVLNVDLQEWLDKRTGGGTAGYLKAVEICEDTRKYLRQNVTAELALESLFYRVGSAVN